jgi:hypothetical protein
LREQQRGHEQLAEAQDLDRVHCRVFYPLVSVKKIIKNSDEAEIVIKDKKKKIRRKNITIEIVNP